MFLPGESVKPQRPISAKRHQQQAAATNHSPDTCTCGYVESQEQKKATLRQAGQQATPRQARQQEMLRQAQLQAKQLVAEAQQVKQAERAKRETGRAKRETLRPSRATVAFSATPARRSSSMPNIAAKVHRALQL